MIKFKIGQNIYFITYYDEIKKDKIESFHCRQEGVIFYQLVCTVGDFNDNDLFDTFEDARRELVNRYAEKIQRVRDMKEEDFIK